MTVTEVRTCMYCMRPALDQHKLFQDDGTQVLTYSALCHAHDFLNRYRESPSYQNPNTNYAFACPACEYDEAEITINYTFLTEDGCRIGPHTHSALYVTTMWDTSELRDGEITMAVDLAADIATDRLFGAITSSDALRETIGVTDLEGSSLQEVNNDQRVNDLANTVEISDISAQCTNCGHLYDAEIV